MEQVQILERARQVPIILFMAYAFVTEQSLPSSIYSYFGLSFTSLCNVEELINFHSGAGIDLSSLSIVDGKVCWDLYIDCLIVSSDGNLLDALGAAIKVYVICVLYSLYLFFRNTSQAWR